MADRKSKIEEDVLSGFTHNRIGGLFTMEIGIMGQGEALAAVSPYAFHFNDQGRFCADSLCVKDLADKYGTPLAIISLTQLEDNLRRFKRSFAEEWQGKVRILPAIKANTSAALCRVLSSETDGCDLFSEGELSTALENGFNPESLSLNGNSKLTADMKTLALAISKGVRITMDDKSEFEAIEGLARKLNRRAVVRLRLRPRFSGMNRNSDLAHGLLVPTELAHFAYKAGIPEEDLADLGDRILKSEWLDLSGVHIHLGRHRKEVDYWQAEMRGYAIAIQNLKKLLGGWEPREIDIGGGFAQHLDPFVPYHRDQSMKNQFRMLYYINKIAGIFGNQVRYAFISALLRQVRGRLLPGPCPDLSVNTSPAIEDYSRCAAHLRMELNRLGIDTKEKTLEVEPGRALFGSAAIHVCRISFIKKQARPVPWSWVVTDTTECWLQGANNPPNQPFIVDGKPLDRYAPQNRMIADITGKSCAGDRITGDACLPGDLAPGDLIVYVGTGAYQEMQSPNFNSMPRPATVAVKGALEGLIRRRETLTEVFGRDQIPEWLK
ncbi:MAG: alanine racemase [Proteobacteria bacterium]|nr:alanine racemase [Pseudomonadota bacterium]